MAKQSHRLAGALAAAGLALVSGACARCSPPVAPAPPPAHLAAVPDGFGEPYSERRVLRVRERALVLVDGRACGDPAGDAACAEALVALRGEPLAVEIDAALLMADLSAPLAALARALEPGQQACLVVRDSKSVRCLPFRPMSGEEFGAWLDAPKPFGKIRIVMRSDGIEVVADRGKVPGPDRFGPSLPSKLGKPDFEGLEPIARALGHNFDDEEAVVVPSAGTTFAAAARALGALSGPGAERFPRTFLVYP